MVTLNKEMKEEKIMSTMQNAANALFDRLREEGSMNMFGAAPVAEQILCVTPIVARGLLAEWMETFAERHA